MSKNIIITIDYVEKGNNGWYVASESGKRLSKVYPTKQEAQQRLKEIEYFKNKK